MAEAIVGPLLSKLQDVAVQEAKALAEVGGDIDKLRDKLLWLHALVHEADLRSRHDGNQLVRVLAFQICDAGFDVEDAVDHFYLQGSLSRRFGRHSWWRISKEFILNLRTHVFVRATLSRRIRSINVRLEEIMGNNSTYNLTSQSGSGDGKTWRASRAIPHMRTDWDRDYLKEFGLKYRGKERKELMNKIKNKNVSEVITVVGVAGVGKTALLMHAYKESKQEGFKCIWLSFRPDINGESMLKQIQEKLGSEKVCCLVVIDSPVSTMTWRKVQNKILDMVGKGSKIVLPVTSSWREEKTKQSTTMSSRDDSSKEEETHCTIIELGPLNEDESTRLFNHVYGLEGRRGANYQVAEMNHIRDCIMEITNGLPLAVVLVAKLMRTMDFGKWEAAADFLKCNSEDNKLKTVVSVCIDDLSDELKSCLLYTAGFPENRPIDAHQLVRLWTAEGFLTQQHKLEMEQLGQCYLKELIYRGLLHLKKKAPGGNVLWVTIPDQIHPLLRSEAQRTSFMNVHYGGSLPPPGNTRRLALHSYNHKFRALDYCLEKLRTVLSYSDDDCTVYPYGHKQEKSSKDEHKAPEQSSKDEREHEPKPKLVMREFLQRSPYLRVINLEGIQFMKKKKKDSIRALPRAIGEMVHLQYLGVRCQELKKVPTSIGNLRNLQTIDVRGTGVRSLPESLWKVKNLRHVLGDRLRFPRSSTGVADHLNLMHTLESVTIDHHDDDPCRCYTGAACKIRKLKLLRFHSLHRLHVAELKKTQVQDLASVLEGLSSLEALILSGQEIPMDFFTKVPEDTASWMKHMEFLMLAGALHLPDASNIQDAYPCLVNVTHLVLRSTNIGQEFIQCISKLPVLTELELLEGSYKDKELTIGTDEFNSLTMLRISGLLDKLDKISVSDATKRNKAINMDVPDHVKVVTTDKQSPSEGQSIAGTRASVHQAEISEDDDLLVNIKVVMTDKQNPSEGQSIAGTRASVHQAEISKDDDLLVNIKVIMTDKQNPSEQQQHVQSNNNDQDGSPLEETILEAAPINNSSITTTTTLGGQPTQDNSPLEVITETILEASPINNSSITTTTTLGGQPTQDNSPLEVITEMILEAAHINNSSITSITNYIKDTYVAVCLHQMEQSGMFMKQKTNNGRSKYVIDRTSNWSSSSADKLQIPIITKMILEAANKNNSSITSITNYIKDTYVAKCLEKMVKSGTLRKEKANGHSDKYVILNR